ncbi:hypothetical protein [Streptomyces vilmorinianum]|uniref:hypothetical protein n=1 Tax=Streptomyces vilmorinianum TaxID=3051092 RepID=UPI0010FADF51|nr:hypothetical protein [Streptomyces vilmorinianum]
MDVEQVTEELYGLRPDEFTAARDAYVAAARKEQDAGAAKAIAALRRPTTAAWASNLFVRERRADVERLLALGETLREAHRLLDPEKMREASGQRHKVIAALTREAAGLAEQAGQPVSDTVLREVEQIFHAVLAGADVANEWARGTLVKAPEAAVGFGVVTPEAVPARPTRKAKEPPPRERRTTAEEAEAAVAEAGRRDEELHQAEGSLRAAQARVTEREEQLRAAQQARREAQAEAASADKAVKAARRAAQNAHRAAARATRRLEERAD